MSKLAILKSWRAVIAMAAMVLMASLALFWKVMAAPAKWQPPSIAVSGTAYLSEAQLLRDDPTVVEFRALAADARFGESLAGKVAVVALNWSSPTFPSEASACDLDVYVVAPPDWRWAHWASDRDVGNGSGESDLYFAQDGRFAHKKPLTLFTPPRGNGRIAAIAMIPKTAQAAVVIETYVSLYCRDLDPRGIVFDGPKFTLSM